MREDNYITLPQIHSSYCDFIDSCGHLLNFTSSKRLQEDKVKEIETEIYKIKRYKHYAISKKAEEKTLLESYQHEKLLKMNNKFTSI